MDVNVYANVVDRTRDAQHQIGTLWADTAQRQQHASSHGNTRRTPRRHGATDIVDGLRFWLVKVQALMRASILSSVSATICCGVRATANKCLAVGSITSS